MKRLILVRAGSTAWDEENRLQGTVSLPLSEEGQRQLDALAMEIQRLDPDTLYSSGNESSGPTAKYLTRQCNLKARKLPCLHEVDCGLWQGMSFTEIKKRNSRVYRQWREDPASVTPPEGESFGEALVRIRAGLAVLQRKNRGKTVLLVAAPLCAALIQCALEETPLEEMWSYAEQSFKMRVFDFVAPDSLELAPTPVTTGSTA